MTERNMLTIQNWIDVGYKQHNQQTPNNSDFLLQKCIRDENGKKYFINVWVYEHYNKDYFSRVPVMHPVGFSPEVQFRKEGDITTNIDLILNEDSTILEVERHFEGLWFFLGRPYYEKWND